MADSSARDDAAFVVAALSGRGHAVRLVLLASPARDGALGPADVDVIVPVRDAAMPGQAARFAFLDGLGPPVLGGGYLADALASDRAVLAAVLAADGLPVVPWCLVRRQDLRDTREVLDRIEATAPYPLWVRSARRGRGPEVRVLDGASLVEALAALARYEARLYVCAAATGKRRPYALLEERGGVRAAAARPGPALEAVAGLAFAAACARDLALVDVFETEGGELHVQDVDVAPSLSGQSPYVRLWQAAGRAPDVLIDGLIRAAAARTRLG